MTSKYTFIFSLVVLFSTSILNAQVIQSGFVEEYNGASKRNPIQDVQITVYNAGSTTSGKDGRFKLVFRTLQPGSKVNVKSIEKRGYVTFNEDAVNEWRIADDGTPFTIILCKSAKFKAMKDHYNAMASKTYREQQEKELAEVTELKRHGDIAEEEYQCRVQEIINYYEDRLENLDIYIDKFARIDLSSISNEEEQIIEMVQSGDIDGAIAKYDAMKLDSRYVANVHNKEKIGEGVMKLKRALANLEKENEATFARIVNKHNLMAIKGGREVFNQIENELQTIADADTTNMTVLKHFVKYLIAEDRNDNAEKYCKIIIRNYQESHRTSQDIVNYIEYVTALANIHHKVMRYDEAIAELEGLLPELEKIKDAHPEIYDEFNSLIHLRIARCYRDNEKMELAGIEMTYAVDEYEKLFISDPDRYSLQYAQALTDLISFSIKNTEKDHAEEIGNTVLSILERYDSFTNHYDILKLKSEVYFHLSKIRVMEQDLEEAIAFGEKQLNYFDSLYSYNPFRYGLDYVETLTNHSITCNNIGYNEKAKTYAIQAISIIENNGQMNKEIIRLLCKCYLSLGLATLQNPNEALQHLNTVENFSLSQYELYPDDFSDIVSATEELIAICYNSQDDNINALEHTQIGLKMARDKAQKIPSDDNMLILGINLSNVALMSMYTEKLKESESNFIEAISILESLYDSHQNHNYIFVSELARAKANYGLLKIKNGLLEEAEGLINEATAYFSNGKIQDIGVDQVNLIIYISTFRGLLALKRGDYEKAKETLKDIMENNPDFIQQNPNADFFIAMKNCGLMEE